MYDAADYRDVVKNLINENIEKYNKKNKIIL